MRALAVLVAVAAAAAAVLFTALGTPFDDPGEGMHAEIARELFLSRDLTRLTLNGVPYLDKPPLLYVLQAIAFVPAGPSERAARLVPAAGALAAVAATVWFGARLLGAAAGGLAGIALLTSAIFFADARYLRPETLFVASLAWGFALTLVGLAERRRHLVGFGVLCFGVAGLAKDPLGVVAPPIAIVVAAAVGGWGAEAARALPRAALATAGAIGLGWWAVAERVTSGAAWYTAIDNKLSNVLGSRAFPDEDVPLAVLEFIAVVIVGALPWTMAAVITMVRLARARAWRVPAERTWIVLAVWVLAVVGLSACSRFRLPHYGLPAYPAVALLAARAWHDARGRALAVVHVVLFGVLAGVLALAWSTDGTAFTRLLVRAADLDVRKAQRFVEVPPFPAWSVIQPLLGWSALVLGVGAAASLVVCLRRGSRSAAAVVAVTMMALMPMAAVAHAQLSAARSVRGLAEFVGRHAAATDVIVHEGPIETSGAFEWYSGRRPVIIDSRRSVLSFAAGRPSFRDVFWDDARVVAASRAGRVWLVSTRPADASIVTRLPEARLVRAEAGRRLYVTPELSSAR